MAVLVEVATVVLILGVLAAIPFWWHDRKYVRSLSLELLEVEAFRFEREYFEILGLHQESVVRFRELTEARDLDALIAERKGIFNQFHKLERQAGHSGRPLIFDYYGPYDKVLFELRRRRKGSW